MRSSPAEPERWRRVVGALALTEVVSWGVLYYAFGVLVPPMQAELGWSQGTLGGAFALALLVSALLAGPVGRRIERRGPRAVMTAGSCAGALLLLAWSEVESPLALYALFAALGVALACTLYEAAFAAVVGLLGPGRRTDVALLFVTIVAGLASTVFVPATQALVELHGWRAALRILAVALAVLTVPAHALLLPGRTEAPFPAPRPPPGAPRGDVEARAVARVALAFALATVAGTSLGVFLVPILVEQGFSPAFVAWAGGAIGVAQVAGRIAFTWLRPRWSLAAWSVALFAPCALGLVVLASRPGAPLALAAVALFSIAAGGQTLARAAWTLELFPASSFARVNGVVGRWSLLGRAGAPLALGATHDALGSHSPGLVALALACVAGGWCAWRAARDRTGRTPAGA